MMKTTAIYEQTDCHHRAVLFIRNSLLFKFVVLIFLLLLMMLFGDVGNPDTAAPQHQINGENYSPSLPGF